jgi:hypothetical protein
MQNAWERRENYKKMLSKTPKTSHQLEGLGRRWDTKIDLNELQREGVEWIILAQDRSQWLKLVKTAMNFRFL